MIIDSGINSARISRPKEHHSRTETVSSLRANLSSRKVEWINDSIFISQPDYPTRVPLRRVINLHLSRKSLPSLLLYRISSYPLQFPRFLALPTYF
ncbi:hypothetical protein PGTUg99_027914 [Puccinia graminis f. sp. tritici]|uniref:Uncharacterized protein n=1 Tax=Puccinia graminis f. sp. tritici TaxID=56615 RepID=A0A5B0REV9_PUCGR|nr:hypothetical protein PGTUg99_027914 [Puccinia graminis f. sp. tritici]